jgi:uncharacterized membrane protein YgdD (TMEM256/DUF423 family)
MERIFTGLAGLSGAAAVIADAAQRHVLGGGGMHAEFAATGARYGLVHAAALVAVALLLRGTGGGAPRAWLVAAGWCFVGGEALFSCALYLLAAGVGVAPLVPVGGTLFIAGWAALFLAAVSPRPLA